MWKKYENGVFLANHVLPTFSYPGVLDATLQASNCDWNVKIREKISNINDENAFRRKT